MRHPEMIIRRRLSGASEFSFFSHSAARCRTVKKIGASPPVAGWPVGTDTAADALCRCATSVVQFPWFRPDVRFPSGRVSARQSSGFLRAPPAFTKLINSRLAAVHISYPRAAPSGEPGNLLTRMHTAIRDRHNAKSRQQESPAYWRFRCVSGDHSRLQVRQA